MLPVIDIHWRAQFVYISRRIRGQPEQEAGKASRVAAARVGQQPARIAAIVSESILGRVANAVEAALDRMPPGDPGERVAEGEEMLVLGPESVAPARAEGGEGAAEVDPDVAEGRARVLAHDRKVSPDIAVIEADALEERGGRGVAVPEKELEVETAARLVDDVGREDARVRYRKSVVTPVVVSQAQSDIGRQHRDVGLVNRLHVVDRAELVLGRKVMIYAQGAEVAHETAASVLEEIHQPPVGRNDRRVHARHRKVVLDKGLGRGIEQTRRYSGEAAR